MRLFIIGATEAYIAEFSLGHVVKALCCSQPQHMLNFLVNCFRRIVFLELATYSLLAEKRVHHHICVHLEQFLHLIKLVHALNRLLPVYSFHSDRVL